MPFQKQCVKATQAHYTANANGTVQVINQCQTQTGEISQVTGQASIKAPGQLQVSFFNLLGWWVPFAGGPYWVVALDPNYQWVVVSAPKRKYAWLLSRTPRIHENEYRKVMQALTTAQIDPCKLITTPQKGGLGVQKPLCKVYPGYQP